METSDECLKEENIYACDKECEEVEKQVNPQKQKYKKGENLRNNVDHIKVKISKYKPGDVDKLKGKYKQAASHAQVPFDLERLGLKNKNKMDFKDKKKRKKKSSKEQSLPDPVVANISEILSNSLLIESPEKPIPNNGTRSEEKDNGSEKNELIEKIIEDDNKTTQEIVEKSKKVFSLSLRKCDVNKKPLKSNLKKVVFKTECNTEISPAKSNQKEDLESPAKLIEKKNVFQVMMDSRLKSIGTNSPGKEKIEEDLPNETAKKKLKNRKLFLGDWADKKGGTKRKLEEEGKDKYIAKKLDKRTKRMKDLLSNSTKQDTFDESSNDSIIDLKTTSKKGSKTKVIFTDSDNSNDSFKLRTGDLMGTDEDTIELISVDKLEEKRKDIEDNKDIDDVLFSPSLKKTSLLHYFDVTPKEKNKTQDVSDKESLKRHILKNSTNIEPSEIIKVKLNFTPKKNKNKCEFNSIVDENISLNENSKHIKKKKKRVILSLKNSASFTSEMSKEPEEQIISPISIKSDDSFVNGSVKEDKIKNIKTPDKKIQLSESKKFTPRMRWHMKVRLLERSEEKASDDNNGADDGDDYDNDEDQIFPKQSRSVSNTPASNRISENTTCERNALSEMKKPVKLAPLFINKPKLEDIVAAKEARKKFLHSGVPSHMKKMMKIVKSLEEYELEPFPKISHVQQRAEDQMDFWDLPNTSLILPEVSEDDFEIEVESMRIGMLTNCKPMLNTDVIHKQLHAPPKPLPNIKNLIKDLKRDCPNYPVYKTFRLLSQKFGKRFPVKEIKPVVKPEKVEELIPKKKRGRPKKKKVIPDDSFDVIALEDISEISLSQKLETDVLMWTEKYKPQSSEDIIGNDSCVQELKSWLKSWLDYSIERRTTKNKRRRLNSDSSDDFYSDNDSKDTDRIPQNTMILLGPYGSGKTSTVYALCNELNINVLEINASSKRPGKKILLELQEATQSHQVKNTDTKSVSNFFLKVSSQEQDKMDDENANKKLSLLLFEDADIVFDDQDEGFLSALTTIISTSKRPIIITSSDQNCGHLQKLFSQHKILVFNALSSKTLGTWLEILCLVEGVRVNKNVISQFLEWNKGDVRRSILELQFWVKSGGDKLKINEKSASSSSLYMKSKRRYSTEVDILFEDDNSNLSWMSEADSQIINNSHELDKVHSSCLRCFLPFHNKKDSALDFQKLPYPVDIGNIWWNIPNIIRIKNTEHNKIFTNYELKCATDSIQNSEQKDTQETDVDKNNIEKEYSPDLFCTQESNKQSDRKAINPSSLASESSKDSSVDTNKTVIEDLNAIADIFDNLAFTDVVYTKLKVPTDFEPCFDYWKIPPLNSLSVQGNNVMFKESDDISQGITHWLVENSIIQFKKMNNENIEDMDINYATPVAEERRWRKKQHTAIEGLIDAIPIANYVDRRSLSVDYQSTLRTICRSENLRFIANNKRKNRFYHYLKGLNVHLNDAMYDVVCNSLAYYGT